MLCPKCGAQNDPSARFCNSCGANLAVDPRAPNRLVIPLAIVSGLLAACLVLLVFSRASHLVAPATPPAQTAQAPVTPASDQPENTAPPQAESSDTTSAVDPGRTAAKPEPKPAPEPSEDPVAEAQVVLENYLAADLGHDGNEMAKYLGGQAKARFRPDVQGQEDITVHSEEVSGHKIRDANTIDFKVSSKWSPSDSEEVKTQKETYILKRTDKGWKITSTPAYPAS